MVLLEKAIFGTIPIHILSLVHYSQNLKKELQDR